MSGYSKNYMTTKELEEITSVLTFLNSGRAKVEISLDASFFDSNGEKLGELGYYDGNYVFVPGEEE